MSKQISVQLTEIPRNKIYARFRPAYTILVLKHYRYPDEHLGRSRKSEKKNVLRQKNHHTPAVLESSSLKAVPEIDGQKFREFFFFSSSVIFTRDR